MHEAQEKTGASSAVVHIQIDFWIIVLDCFSVANIFFSFPKGYLLLIPRGKREKRERGIPAITISCHP